VNKHDASIAAAPGVQSDGAKSEVISAAEFLAALFEHTVEQVYICSFPNDRDDPQQASERHMLTRKPGEIEQFIKKWDKPGRGAFVCMGTIKLGAVRRCKETISETIGLHADIDFKNVDGLPSDPLAARDAVLKQIARLKYQPSAIVFSGGGIHAYWLFKEPMDTQAKSNIDRIELALRQLADIVAGDLAVCEVARVMRLPGSHNTKDGNWTEVQVLALHPERRYELDDLEEWFAEQSPIMLRKVRERGTTVGARDPFLEYAKEHGYKPPIDVEARLAAMIYMGAGENSIHETQLQCGASMLSRGEPVERVVAILLAATRVAAGDYGKRWNWRIEERNIRRDCLSWIKKHPPETKVEAKPKPELKSIEGGKAEPEQQAVAGNSSSNVVPLQQQQQEPGVTKTKKDVAALVCGGLIKAIRGSGRDIMLTEGEVWIYEDGIWRIMSPAEEQWIRSLIHTGFDTLNEPKKTAALNNCWKLLTEHPELFKHKVEWADAKVIVCANGVLDIDTREFSPHGPQQYARHKIDTEYDPSAQCPQFLKLIGSIFSEHAEPDKAIALFQEWLGSALATARLAREQRKALIMVGKSRTGKTELSSSARFIIGEPIASPSVSEITETFGMQNFINKRAWIRDDAINEGDKLDPKSFKVIVTGEQISIRRMNKPALETRLQIPVLLTANSLPRARDHSDALYNRSIVLRLDKVISEADAVALRKKLGVPVGFSIGAHIMQTEAPGVLNWALAGLGKLLECGAFDVPDGVAAAIREFKEGNNPVAEFARVAVKGSANCKVERADLLCAYHGWLREQEGEEARASGARWFFPKLRQAVEGIGDSTDKNGRRFMTGIALTEEGLHHWEAHKNGHQLRGGSSGFAIKKADVNAPWIADKPKGEGGDGTVF
jgi:P4 family phage/plasmid primase-like protien